MTVAPGATCPSCHAAVAPGSAFCTRCGSPVAVREIAVPTADDQQWGGQRRRDRRGRGASGGAGGPAPGPAGVPAGVPAPPGSALGQAGHVAVLAPGARPTATGPVGGAVAGAAPAGVAAAHPGAAALGPAFDGVVPAGVGRRLGAYTLDLVTVAAVGGLVWWLTGGQAVYAGLAAGELAVGLVLWEARGGLTLGNAVLGLRTAAVERPYAPGLGRAVGRALLLGLSNVLAGLGPWVLVATSGADRSGRGQAWHDRAARTVVVDVRAMRVGPVEPGELRGPVVTSSGAVGAPAAPVPVPPAAPPVVPVAPAPVAPAAVVPAPVAAPPAVVPAPVAVPPAVVPAPPGPVAAPLAVAPALPAPAPAPAVVPAPPAPAPVAVPGAAPGRRGYVITLDTGQTVEVTGKGVIGRRPRPGEGEDVEHVVEVDDTSRSMSRTHAAFGVADGVFWVADRGSANGTYLRDAAGTWHRLEPGTRYPVAPGGVVRLGERTFTVTSA